MIKFCWWRHEQKLWRLFQNTFILRRPRAAHFANIIKIATMFIKTTLSDSNNLRIKMQSLAVFLDIKKADFR